MTILKTDMYNNDPPKQIKVGKLNLVDLAGSERVRVTQATGQRLEESKKEMSEQVMRQHIDLYVNDFSIDMGDTGRKAIAQLEQSFSALNK